MRIFIGFVAFLAGVAVTGIVQEQEFSVELERAKSETKEEHDYRIAEPIAWELAHNPDTKLARDICDKKKLVTWAGKVIVDCKDPGGRIFTVYGFETDWTLAVTISTPGELVGEDPRIETNPDKRSFVKYRRPGQQPH